MELEAELQEQLVQQREALEGLEQLLAADPAAVEAELVEELRAGIKETEEALLGLTRQRLLAELDALHGGDADQQQPEAATGGGGVGGSAPPLASGSLCIFRHTDGRHYFGTVLDSDAGSGNVRLQFAHPTKAYQLEGLVLPAGALHPAPASSSMQPAGCLHAGLRVLVKPTGSQLWQAAELTEVDSQGQRVAAVTLENKQRHVLSWAAVALSPFAPDPHASGSDADSSSSGDGQSDGSGSGSDDEDGASSSLYSGSEDEAGASDGEGNGFDDDEEEEESGLGFGRVSMAMADAADLLQQQAAAGPQTATALFFSSEGHSRGIGSKLLAKMGFKGQGHGLGRKQQGMQQALQAMQMKKGAGLGVDTGGGGVREGKKRKRSGKQRRRDKAAKAGLEEREAKRQAQQELERRTGSEGLFAVLNSIIGDSSQAQAVKEANLGMRSSAEAGGGSSSRQGHLFASSSSGSRAGGKTAPKEEDRRALAKRADELTQLRQKVQRLSEMAARNAKDRVMLPQIKRALAEAQGQLRAAESQHAASHQRIHQKEALKRMTKF